MRLPEKIARKRLLLVEDDRPLCESLEEILSAHHYEVSALLSDGSIPRVMERSSFNLVILGIQLPEEAVFYWMKWLKSYYPYIPVIILSSRVAPEYRVQALESGARDYIVKPFHHQELLIRVKFALEEMANDARQSVIQIGDFTLDTITNCINKDNETIPLTRLECKILQLLYINAGMPLSREDLMWQTMGIRYVPSNRSIDTHVNRLRKKIEKVPADPLYIRTVRGRGYCFHLPRT